MNLSPDWQPRAYPLEPTAMAAQGEAAKLLALKLLSFDDARLSNLQGVSGMGILLILGTTACLPWVDGAVYLGRDPSAPSLMLPTNMELNLPVSILERAFWKREPNLLPPLAVLPGSCLILSASDARTLSRPALQKWLEMNG